jgi:hypothetical protein
MVILLDFTFSELNALSPEGALSADKPTSYTVQVASDRVNSRRLDFSGDSVPALPLAPHLQKNSW